MNKKIGHIKNNSALTTKKNIDDAELTVKKGESHINELSRKEIRAFLKKLRKEKEETYLDKSKYNIDFVISMIKTLIDHVERNKMNPQDLAFSLNHSLKRLLANLQVDKDQGIR